jgi:uncharacterized membrane protein HdeD (DUF308 family)
MSTSHTADLRAGMRGLGAALAPKWWAVAIRGALAILFALIAFSNLGATMLSLVLVFAIYSLLDGVFALIGASRAGARWGLLVLEGIVDLGAAGVALLWPGITVVAFVFLIAAWAILSGALMLGAAFRANADHGRIWLIVGGVASILYGVLLFGAPATGAVVVTWWIGLYALIFGAALIMLSLRLRKAQKALATAR